MVLPWKYKSHRFWLTITSKVEPIVGVLSGDVSVRPTWSDLMFDSIITYTAFQQSTPRQLHFGSTSQVHAKDTWNKRRDSKRHLMAPQGVLEKRGDEVWLGV